ncbi:hypothetical protein FA15DRAFT_657391 [Coprinopsis marcescibilis]|uniref:CBM1 domain-containing protein n=1 Tax=Coprinopsis marcescibilis TaxID=230819 RepID=A0A5C3KQK0_COPMA|nr:hypothetical protein FA15DRAFT_657391 [Coprinopsis marcescibilis]
MWGIHLSIAALVASANGYIRFGCSQLVTERLDPLSTPGQAAPHVHQVVGGNAFNATLPLSYDLGDMATCTSCRFEENRSNYWTAVMYFKGRNGTYMRVPQISNQFVGKTNGGMTVYYIQPIGSNEKVTAFPKGFRMIVGDPMSRARRTTGTNDIDARAITYRCFGPNFGTDPEFIHPGTGNLDTVALPAKTCAGGIRSNIFFPSCWNGKDLDPADHASHMTYPTGTIGRDGLFFQVGSCPASHPIRMPLLFLEIVWDTREFNSQWPTDGSQPLIMSNGDPTGYGQHADYIFGWKGDSLQRAMNQCIEFGGDCPALTRLNDVDINRCRMNTVINERVEGVWLDELPGCNPPQAGPGKAIIIRDCKALSTIGIAPVVVTPAPPNPTGTPAPSGSVPRFGQCGGQGWTGPTQCVSPYVCQATNQWYSQCCINTDIANGHQWLRRYPNAPLLVNFNDVKESAIPLRFTSKHRTNVTSICLNVQLQL